MGVIDADTHIDETEDTWEWMTERELVHKPKPDAPAVLDPNRPPVRYWLIDGQRHHRFIRDDKRSHTTIETRELLDPMARVRQMDELGTDVHVIYPTTFLAAVSEKPEVDVAVKRSYNRWLADRCSKTNGRLRWVCLPPLSDIDKAIEEVRFAKANGACGVLKKGDLEAGHWVSQEYFFPFYEECEKLDLAICFHLGSGTPDHSSAADFEHARYYRNVLPPVNAFLSLATFAVPHRFPGLRWGFIEVGASWVPFTVYTVLRRKARLRRTQDDYTYEQPSDVVRLNNFYMTCQVDEDLPSILRFTGEDRLLVGSDYVHTDPSHEWEFPRLLQERADRGDIPQSAIQKILHDNACAFYGL
jgi:predicted TIM-barrel fold metal-dependent hydrolase